MQMQRRRAQATATGRETQTLACRLLLICAHRASPLALAPLRLCLPVPLLPFSCDSAPMYVSPDPSSFLVGRARCGSAAAAAAVRSWRRAAG